MKPLMNRVVVAAALILAMGFHMDDAKSQEVALEQGRGPGRRCISGDQLLCLNQGRFRVQVNWRDFEGGVGKGTLVPFRSDDSGLFWFFHEDNWEMLVKVLDGCAINGHFWVFSAATTTVEYTLHVTDTATQRSQSYFNSSGNPAEALTDVTAFATCDRSLSRRSGLAEDSASSLLTNSGASRFTSISSTTAGTCSPGEDVMCLHQGRYRVEVNWRDFQDGTGSGKVVPFGSDDSGLLWFFDEDNWEMLVKVLDGCAVNGHVWVFSAATTNVEYTLRVTDTQSGLARSYVNPLGTRAAAITDVQAFTCPG